MHLLIISGSHRSNSQSAKVARHLSSRATDLGLFEAAPVLDLAASELPFWAEDAFDPNNDEWKSQLATLNQQLASANAYAFVSPEWHGMVPSRLRNLLLFANVRNAGHKPALLTAVSGSRGGAYPIAELRMNGFKNSRVCCIPEHLIVRNAEQVLNDGEPADDEDRFIRARADFALRNLAEYARVMAQMDRDILVSKEFPNGM
jgi:NAD(P)H-dependent FMN reductase